MLEALARQLADRRGAAVAHFCPTPGRLAERLADAGDVPVCVYGRRHRTRDVVDVSRAAARLRFQSRRFEADMLVGSGTRGFLYVAGAATRMGLRTVQIIHDPVERRDPLNRLFSALRAPDVTLFSSRRPLSESPGHIQRRPRASVVQAAIDADRIDRCLAEADSAGAHDHDAGAFVMVARIQEHKGQDVLLEAFKLVVEQIPAARLVFVGEPSPVADPLWVKGLYERVRAYGLSESVRFTGFLPDCALYRLLARSLCLVHSAVHESFGLVLLEAMYLRKPVLTTATEGPSAIVEPGRTGRIVPIGGVRQLADAMLELLASPALAETLGEAGRRRMLQRFPPDAMTNDFSRAISDVVRVGSCGRT